jgi:uncharacterized protein (TIGR02001 family)
MRRIALAVAMAIGGVLLGREQTRAQDAAPAGEAPAAASAVSVTGNVGITTDYAFRGISQTLREPALQGGVDLVGPYGMYAGIWGSSLNFGEDLAAGPRAQVEVDGVVGIAPQLFGVNWQLGGVYYAYPGAAKSRNYDYVELVLGAGRSFGPAAVKLSGAYSPDFFAASGTGMYMGGTLSFTLPMKFSADVAAGRQLIEDHAAFGAGDYTHWQAGLSAVLLGLKLSAAYATTDLSAAECFNGMDLCEGRVIFGFSHSR